MDIIKSVMLNVALLFFLFAINSIIDVSAQSHKSKDPVAITDSNWTNVLEGEWMIEFMAPWCPACKSFKEVWEEFAGWGHDLDITVGVVDVTENPGLSGRFLVTSLPTLYHIKDGMFRHYSGSRKTSDLIDLIDDKKWNNIEPVAWYRDPSSLQMGLIGAFFKAAMFFRGVYSTMTEVYGIPEWLCYVIFAVLTIVTGLILGLLLVLCCDSFFPAKYLPLPPQQIAYNPEYIPENDTDLIDDTVDKGNPDGRVVDDENGAGEGANLINDDAADESDNQNERAGDGDGTTDREKESNSGTEASAEDSKLRKRQPKKDN